MKVLFTSPILEHPPAGGPQLRIENSIKALSKICDLHIIAQSREARIGGAGAREFYSRLSNKFSYTPAAKAVSLRGIAGRVKRYINRVLARNDANYIAAYLDKHKIQILWCGYGNISYPLIKDIKSIRPNIKVVCDTDSVWSRYILRKLPFVTDEQEKLKIITQGKEKEQEEAEWVRLCDVTTAVSEIDAEYYRDLTDEPDKIKIFSNVIDLDTYSNPGSAKLRHPCVYLAGSYKPNNPMDQAARWVINEVLPLVRQSVPDLHFYIIGNGAKKTLHDINKPDISIIGKLPSLLPYLLNIDIVLVPLKYESGTRYKIIEAGACGKPVVSTTLGAEGLPVTHEKDILIADQPQAFATSIVRLLRDRKLAEQLGANLKKLVSANYDINKLAQEGQSILKYIYPDTNVVSL